MLKKNYYFVNKMRKALTICYLKTSNNLDIYRRFNKKNVKTQQ